MKFMTIMYISNILDTQCKVNILGWQERVTESIKSLIIVKLNLVKICAIFYEKIPIWYFNNNLSTFLIYLTIGKTDVFFTFSNSWFYLYRESISFSTRLSSSTLCCKIGGREAFIKWSRTSLDLSTLDYVIGQSGNERFRLSPSDRMSPKPMNSAAFRLPFVEFDVDTFLPLYN